MHEIGYHGYTSYELCHQLPVVNGETVGIEFAHQERTTCSGIHARDHKAEYAQKPGKPASPQLVRRGLKDARLDEVHQTAQMLNMIQPSILATTGLALLLIGTPESGGGGESARQEFAGARFLHPRSTREPRG